MTAPRVFFFTTSYPCWSIDRAGPFVHALARALVRSGAKVEVLAPAFGTAASHSSIDGVEIHRFRYAPLRWQTVAMGFGGVPVALKRAPWSALQLPLMTIAAAALSLRAAGRCDVLHAHWLPNLLPLAPAARLRRRPRLVTLWGSDVEWFERAPRLQPAFRTLLRGADGIAAINHHMHDLFQPLVKSGTKVRLIPSGVDTSLFRPRDKNQLRARLGFASDSFIMLCVGSVIARKGFDVAIESLTLASGSARRAVLLVVGEGPERSRLEHLAEQLGVAERVRFVGERSVVEVADFMAASDAFVLPSRYEGRPNVLLEAQASGLAVVASDIPGCSDLIEHGETGMLTPAADAAAMADALTLLANDAALRAKLGESSRRAIHDRGYTWDACARAYLDFYEDTLGVGASALLRSTASPSCSS